jgi:hypothetical protein
VLVSVSTAQTTFPDESVVSFPPFERVEQLAVEIVRPPDVIARPPENVLVAELVCRIDPPVIDKPFEDFNPADEKPPENVEVPEARE